MYWPNREHLQLIRIYCAHWKHIASILELNGLKSVEQFGELFTAFTLTGNVVTPCCPPAVVTEQFLEGGHGGDQRFPELQSSAIIKIFIWHSLRGYGRCLSVDSQWKCLMEFHFWLATIKARTPIPDWFSLPCFFCLKANNVPNAISSPFSQKPASASTVGSGPLSD